MRYERDWWPGKSMNRANINTYIYIFLHILCKLQVFKISIW